MVDRLPLATVLFEHGKFNPLDDRHYASALIWNACRVRLFLGNPKFTNIPLPHVSRERSHCIDDLIRKHEDAGQIDLRGAFIDWEVDGSWPNQNRLKMKPVVSFKIDGPKYSLMSDK